jgi:hypothetical protein
MNTPDETECTVDAKDIHSIVPDGGLTAWLTVLGAFLIQVAGFGYATKSVNEAVLTLAPADS